MERAVCRRAEHVPFVFHLRHNVHDSDTGTPIRQLHMTTIHAGGDSESLHSEREKRSSFVTQIIEQFKSRDRLDNSW